MAWLARLDTKSRRWPAPCRWIYVGLKWFLIVMGAYSAVGLAYVEVFHEHRVGLGSGIVVAGALAVIKGVLTAVHQAAQSETPHQP